MKYILRYIHYCWIIILILFISFLTYPLMIFFKNRNKYISLNILRRKLAKIILKLAFISINIKYIKFFDKKKTYIYCANHTSYLDILILLIITNGKVFFLGKKELANLPILGFFFKNIDLGIDRNNKDYNKSILQQCSKNLSDGISMIIFPEGTISKNGKRLMNFKNGAFYLSIINKIPIIPISIINAKYIFYNNGLRYGSKPGIIDVVVHSTVFIKKNMNVDTLKSQIFNIIDKSLK